MMIVLFKMSILLYLHKQKVQLIFLLVLLLGLIKLYLSSSKYESNLPLI